MALFEFSSSNGYSSFNLFYECRSIQIEEIGDFRMIFFYQSNFFYLVEFPCYHEACCEERGYEKWELNTWDWKCMTSFQGKKCSMMLFLSGLTVIRSDTVKITVTNDSKS